MPVPGDVVTNERLESVLLGVATQIASGMAEVKVDVTAFITERDWAQLEALQT